MNDEESSSLNDSNSQDFLLRASFYRKNISWSETETLYLVGIEIF